MSTRWAAASPAAELASWSGPVRNLRQRRHCFDFYSPRLSLTSVDTRRGRFIHDGHRLFLCPGRQDPRDRRDRCALPGRLGRNTRLDHHVVVHSVRPRPCPCLSRDFRRQTMDTSTHHGQRTRDRHVQIRSWPAAQPHEELPEAVGGRGRRDRRMRRCTSFATEPDRWRRRWASGSSENDRPSAATGLLEGAKSSAHH